MKTSELTGAALDWAAAQCADLPYPHVYDEQGGIVEVSPSTNWAQGGPIIEREKIGLGHEICEGNSYWAATGYLAEECGPTPLVAAMRCYVASKLGDTIDVPEALPCEQ